MNEPDGLNERIDLGKPIIELAKATGYKPLQNEPQLSKCCNASMFVHSGNEGTNYYICNKCKKATDPVGGYSWEKHSTGEPQLSAEMEAAFDAELLKAWSSGDETAVQVAKHFLATALEEQKKNYIEQVQELTINQREFGSDYLYALDDVLAILEGK